MPDQTRNEVYAHYTSQLSSLRQGLPSRFRSKLEKLIKGFPGVFAQDWPLVPNHGDLLENNIHVNPATGNITGICD